MKIRNYKPMSVTFTDKERLKLDALAEDAGVNRSAYIRGLVRKRRPVKKTVLLKQDLLE